MTTIVTRAGKGSALTHNEVDANFNNLNNAKVEADQTVTLTNKTISGSSNTLSNIGNASLTNSSVTIGSTSVSLGSTATTVSGLTLTSPVISSISNTGTLTLPTSTDTLVGRDTTDTLTNKTLTSPTVNTPTISGGTVNNAVIGGSTPAGGNFTTLSATGVTTVQAGTAAAPAITTSGDTNTGILFPAADTVAITTGGAERARVDSAGNVGIGTSSPQSKLVVSDSGGLGFEIKPNESGYVRSFAYDRTGAVYLDHITQALNYRIYTGTSPVERLRIDSAGNLGLGVTPSAWGADYKVQQLNSSAVAAYQTVQFNIGHNWYDSGAGAHKYINNGYATKLRQQAGEFVFEQATSGTAGNAITFETGMMLNVNGALILKGGSSSASGVGITFPATQAASTNANTLDDYEEGTFTPTIVGTTTAGAGTYTYQVGRYTKIGNRVYVQIAIRWTAHTGTGNIRIASLPFTSVNVANSDCSFAIGYVDGLTLTASNIPTAITVSNTSQLSLYQTPTGGGAVSLVAIDTAAGIFVSGHYEV